MMGFEMAVGDVTFKTVTATSWLVEAFDGSGSSFFSFLDRASTITGESGMTNTLELLDEELNDLVGVRCDFSEIDSLYLDVPINS